MALVAVKFKCECEGYVEVRGSEEYKAHEARCVAADRDCDLCYATKVESRRAEALVAAQVQAAERHLPTLEGSEKQIAWAETIRAGIVKAIEKSREKHHGNAEKESLLDEGASMLLSNTSSKFWIEEMRLKSIRPELLDSQLRRSAKEARKAAEVAK